MSKRMAIAQDLSAIWEHTVRAGHLRNRFMDTSGEQVESGIRMTAGGPQHYAIHVETGREICADVKERSLGQYDFAVQLNLYRSLKPQFGKLEHERRRAYSPSAHECLFACQDASNPLSLLQRYSPLRTMLGNFHWAALPNAFPVEKNGHFLWIPAVTHGATTEFPHWLQELTLPLLQDFLVLASMSTNLMTYFNSIHAGASVNHIHFQSVYREKQAAIDKAATLMNRHRYFLKDYPASGLVYMEDTPAETIWHDIGKLQEHGIPFNLIHTGCRIYLVPRNIAYETVAEFPNGVLAAMEISGKAITTEQSFYLEADSAQFQIALRKSTLTIEELLPFLES